MGVDYNEVLEATLAKVAEKVGDAVVVEAMKKAFKQLGVPIADGRPGRDIGPLKGVICNINNWKDGPFRAEDY